VRDPTRNRNYGPIVKRPLAGPRICGCNGALIVTTSRDASQVAVYFIVAEALTNVAKHAHASNVLVDVQAIAGGVRVSVSDDGVGGADPTCGSGLLGLRDRVDALGGTISLAGPSSGTALLVELPMTPERVGISG
jgi:signal transduction histidine kinase